MRDKGDRYRFQFSSLFTECYQFFSFEKNKNKNKKTMCTLCAMVLSTRDSCKENVET